MKIIYLIAGTYRPAGMERVLSLKAHFLADRGHEIVIVTTDQRGQEPVFGLGDFRQIDLGINYESTNGAPFWKKTLLYFPKHARHRRLLRKTLLEEKADIVVSMFNNDVDIVPSIKDGSRKVLEVHFSRLKKMQYARKGLWALADKMRTASDARFAAKYDRFIVLTQEDMTYWEHDCRALSLSPKIVHIPNPRTYRPNDYPKKQREKIVLAAGRYSYQKGFDQLIAAWSKIAAMFPDWKLRIAGDGENEAELQKTIMELHLTKSVELGKANDVKDLFAQASVYALTSRYEGLPMVLLEAQAAALPIVSFKCKCGPLDIVRDGVSGILVEEGDISSFAAALQKLMDNEPLRTSMGQSALKNSENFDEQIIMSQWENLFNELYCDKEE